MAEQAPGYAGTWVCSYCHARFELQAGDDAGERPKVAVHRFSRTVSIAAEMYDATCPVCGQILRDTDMGRQHAAWLQRHGEGA